VGRIIITIIAAILALQAGVAQATIVEVSAATDKATYLFGEEVTVFVTAYNPNAEAVTLSFGSSLMASYMMDGVFDWSEDKVFAQVLTQVTIEAYDSHTWELQHGLYEWEFHPLRVGTHTVVGEVVGYGYSPLVEFEVVPKPVPIHAAIDIDPNTLNLASGGKWITCYIWLPGEYDVADIDPNSVRLENEPNAIEVEWIWFEEEDQVAMARFSRSKVQEMVEPGDVELTVSGELVDGTRFEGIDTIKVINKGRKKK